MPPPNPAVAALPLKTQFWTVTLRPPRRKSPLLLSPTFPTKRQLAKRAVVDWTSIAPPALPAPFCSNEQFRKNPLLATRPISRRLRPERTQRRTTQSSREKADAPTILMPPPEPPTVPKLFESSMMRPSRLAPAFWIWRTWKELLVDTPGTPTSPLRIVGWAAGSRSARVVAPG